MKMAMFQFHLSLSLIGYHSLVLLFWRILIFIIIIYIRLWKREGSSITPNAISNILFVSSIQSLSHFKQCWLCSASPTSVSLTTSSSKSVYTLNSDNNMALFISIIFVMSQGLLNVKGCTITSGTSIGSSMFS